jgi:dipeptidyl aminopeptidase/acylaminoacyl peptidase
MGASYGGYATLAGLTFTPEVFCCGVDIVGPSNLQTLRESFPAYWAAAFEMFARRVGDTRTEAGRALLQERSPLHYAGNIVKPLLIAQGANDPRVKQAEADQIVDAMKAKSLPVTYVLYPEEGHGFMIPENDRSFHAIAEAFLAVYLGMEAEPIGDDFKGAKFEVREGASGVPGLSEAM